MWIGLRFNSLARFRFIYLVFFCLSSVVSFPILFFISFPVSRRLSFLNLFFISLPVSRRLSFLSLLFIYSLFALQSSLPPARLYFPTSCWRIYGLQPDWFSYVPCETKTSHTVSYMITHPLVPGILLWVLDPWTWVKNVVPETSVTNYEPTAYKIPNERKSA